MLKFDSSAIETAIKAAELRTTGEIRVCVERRAQSDIYQRAKDVFVKLGINQTKEHNGVLLYAHITQKKLVVLGDSGIDNKVTQGFWEEVCQNVAQCFARQEMTVGVLLGIMMIGDALARFYPISEMGRTNELPDNIIIGEHI